MTTASAPQTSADPTGSVTVIPHIVAGERVSPQGRTGPVFTPASGRQSGEVALASPRPLSVVGATPASANVSR